MIEVVVHEGNVRSPKKNLQADLGNTPGAQRDSFEVFCAREVFRQLVLLVECLRKEFCWVKRVKYQAGIICPVCCLKRLVNRCLTHHKQDCEQGDCLHFIPESELRNLNHHITCTRSAVAVNNKVYSKDFTAWFGSPREEVTHTLLCFPELFLFPFVERLIFENEPGCCKMITGLSLEISCSRFPSLISSNGLIGYCPAAL